MVELLVRDVVIAGFVRVAVRMVLGQFGAAVSAEFLLVVLLMLMLALSVSVLAVFAYWAVGSAILACPGLAVVAELAPLATDVSLLLASPISFVFIAGIGVESLGVEGCRCSIESE